jgi:7-cyano-7-deazaguanine reductase
LPFFGADLWTGYELSWLNLRGKPQVALVHFTIPCETPNIIESKSFKLYLNSFNNSRFATPMRCWPACADVSEAVWRGATQRHRGRAPGAARSLCHAESAGTARPAAGPPGCGMHRLPAPPRAAARRTETPPVSETLVSHLLKSNCLVTGQPDWGSVQIPTPARPSTRNGCCSTS